jgi:hypothetical protein
MNNVSSHITKTVKRVTILLPWATRIFSIIDIVNKASWPYHCYFSRMTT